jgi:hypothetical protein
MTNAIYGCLTERHLTLFGTIAQGFLRHELLMQEIMATVIGSDTASVMILTRGLSFDAKRDALFSLLLDWRVPVDQTNMIRGYFLLPDALRTLRDDIEHAAWSPGPIPNSIIPDSVRQRPPTSIKVEEQWLEDFAKTGHIEVRGYDLDFLAECTEKLEENYEAFETFVQEVCLIHRQAAE